MPLDGAMLTQVKHELEGALGSRVDRVTQPSREELILALRSRQGASRILISVNAGSPRIHFTQAAVENAKPPIVITHAPGHMFITDILNTELNDYLEAQKHK